MLDSFESQTGILRVIDQDSYQPTLDIQFARPFSETPQVVLALRELWAPPGQPLQLRPMIRNLSKLGFRF